MRDRLVSLGMRKSMRMRNDYCDVPMLALDDFDTEVHPPKLAQILGGITTITDSVERITLARICIEKTKLCLCIGHVLTVQYFLAGGTTTMLTPRGAASGTRVAEVIRCEQELSQWHEDLPEDCRCRMSAANKPGDVHTSEVISIHRAILSMIYCTTVSALHRPEVQSELPSQVLAESLQRLSSWQRVKEAAIEVTEIAHDLHHQDLTRFLPPIGVTVLIPAMIVHLWVIKSGNATRPEASSRRFHQCMQVLQRLREIYASADVACFLVKAAESKMNVGISHDMDQRTTCFTTVSESDRDGLMLQSNMYTA